EASGSSSGIKGCPSDVGSRMSSVPNTSQLEEADRARVRPLAVFQGHGRAVALVVASVAAALPLIGLVSLLLRSRLDPHLENYQVHFVVFGITGSGAFLLGYGAGGGAHPR